MTSKVFALDTKPGIQRDGTFFDKEFYSDGGWVRFQRGRPRKIAGYREISNQMNGPSRGVWVNSQNSISTVFSGYNDGLQSLQVDSNGVGAGITDFSLTSFTASDLNLWQFDGFYDVAGSGVSVLLAHPGQNLAAIDSTTNTPVLYGDINGSTMSKIGVFTDPVTTVNASATITLAATNPLIGAGQTITGAGIPANTTVVSVSTTTVVISNPATASATVTATFDNNVSVSGGVVSLHPYVFVYGNNGFVKNCGAGNTNDWVSADANEVNVATGKIVQGLPVRGGSNSPSGLFWSLDSLIRVSYIGGTGTPPQYWRYDIITSQSSILSSQSAIEYDGIYYWCGVDRFLMYNGVVKEIPNNMNQNWFFDNLNYSQRQKVWACKVPRFGEIWWFYPRGNATECTDAIIYNVRENTWYDAGQAMGSRRSAGYFSQVFQYPVMAGWDVGTQITITQGSYGIANGRATLRLTTANPLITIGQEITGNGIPVDTYVDTIVTSGVNTLGTIIGGTGYTNGTYTNVALIGNGGAGARATIVVSGTSVTTVVLTATGSGYTVSLGSIRLVGAITGGSLYVNGSYADVPLTGGSGTLATANITVSGGAVTAVTIIGQGINYLAGDSLTASNTYLGGAGSGFAVVIAAVDYLSASTAIIGAGTGFSVPITALYPQVVTMTSAATSTGTETLTFSTPPNNISMWQHELGVNEVKGQEVNAIESYFETNDLGLVSGGPSQPSAVGDNVWLHLERVEPDFIQEGAMEMYVTGRPFAQAEDKTTGPYAFDPNTGKIDLREQRRELRLKFRSNVINGNYQLGKLLLNANVGDVRPY